MKNLFNTFNMCIGMFTVIPPFKKVWDENCGKHMMKMFPIIGFIIGIVWFVLIKILLIFNIPKILLSAIILAIPFFITGFLHLDGFMDVCDAILSRREREEKLRILKDSTIGAFSVISLVFLLIIEFSAINIILDKKQFLILIVLIPILSRSLVGYFLISKESISESYFGKLYKSGTGNLDKILLISYILLTFILAFIINIRGIIIIFLMILSSIYLIYKTKRELGGINGDVAGYIITLTECIGIIILALI